MSGETNYLQMTAKTFDGKEFQLGVSKVSKRKWTTALIVDGKHIDGSGPTASAAVERWTNRYKMAFDS